MPTVVDETPLSTAKRGMGRPPKSGGRYGVSKLVVDESSDEEVMNASTEDLKQLKQLMQSFQGPYIPTQQDCVGIAKKRPASTGILKGISVDMS